MPHNNFSEFGKANTYGLMGVSFAILITILQTNIDSAAKWCAVLATAIALPLLVVTVISSIIVPPTRFQLIQHQHVIVYNIGAFAALVAVDATFWHFGVFMGCAFTLMSLGAFLCLAFWNTDNKSKDKK